MNTTIDVNKMNVTELINQIKNNENFNYLGIGITPLHAVGIESSIEYLNSNGLGVNGILLLQSHGVTGRLLNESYFSIDESTNNVSIENFDYIYDPPRTVFRKIEDFVSPYKYFRKKNKERIVYIAWAEINPIWFMILQTSIPNVRIKYILIDDGAGSYCNKFQDSIITYKQLNHKVSIPYIIRRVIEYNSELKIKTKLKKNGDLILGTIFEKREDGVHRNESFVDFYKKSFAMNLQKNSADMSKVDFKDSVLLNTQCLVENGITDGIIDFNVYDKVCKISQKYNKPVLVKPHPRENNTNKYRKIGCSIIENNQLSQESLLACSDVQPLCIISIFSSTLLNAYGLFNIPAVSLAKIVLKENISNDFRKQLKDFIENYSDFFIFPESYEELEEYIKKLVIDPES